MALNSNLPAELAGLPSSWRHYGWWFAGIVFAALWMLESWTSAGAANVSQLAESFLNLLLALAICWGIYRICRPYSAKLGQVLCIASAAAALLAHGL